MKDPKITREMIESITDLPTLPIVVSDIVGLASDPNTSLTDMYNVICRDPPFAAKVLKVANSAFYGMSHQVGSLRTALVILGIDEITRIAIGLWAFAAFPPSNKSTSRLLPSAREPIRNFRLVNLGIEFDGISEVVFDRDKFWQHCTLCGITAKILTQQLGCDMMHLEFVSGLIHDIGKIIVDQYFH